MQSLYTPAGKSGTVVELIFEEHSCVVKVIAMSFSAWLLKGQQPRPKLPPRQEKRRKRRRLLYALLIALMIWSCVGAASRLAIYGVLPRQVNASGVALVEANYSAWEEVYSVNIDFERLATAVKMDEDMPEISWTGPTQVAERDPGAGEPAGGEPGGQDVPGAPSEDASDQPSQEAGSQPARATAPGARNPAATATRRPTRTPSSTRIPPSRTPTPLPSATLSPTAVPSSTNTAAPPPPPPPPPPPTNTSAPPPTSSPTPTATNTTTTTATDTPTNTATNTPGVCALALVSSSYGTSCPSCVRFTFTNGAASAVTITGFSAVVWNESPNHVQEVIFPGNTPSSVWIGNAPSPAIIIFTTSVVVGAGSTVDMDLVFSRPTPPPAPVDVTFDTDQGSCSITG